MNALCAAPLPAVTDSYAWVRWTHHAYAVLETALTRDDEWLQSDPGQDALYRFVQRIGTKLMTCAEDLDPLVERSLIPGWDRLKLTWIVYCHALLLHNAPSVVCRDELAADGLWLEQLDDLVATGTLQHLEFVLEFLSSRLEVLWRVTPGTLTVIRAVERRMAQFVAGQVPDAHYNVPLLVRVARGERDLEKLVGVTAQYAIWFKRFVYFARLSGDAHMFGDANAPGIWADTVPNARRDVTAAQVTATWQTLTRYAGTMNTKEQRMDARFVLRRAQGALTDWYVHAVLHNKFDPSLIRFNDIAQDKLSPESALYTSLEQFRVTSIGDRLARFERRTRKGAPGRLITGQYADEAVVLYVFNAYLLTQLQYSWIDRHVLTYRGARHTFRNTLLRAVRNKFPFLVQRLGQWFVVAMPNTQIPSEAEFDAILEDDSDDFGLPEATHTRVYRCEHIVEAIAQWIKIVLVNFYGRLLGDVDGTRALDACLTG